MKKQINEPKPYQCPFCGERDFFIDGREYLNSFSMVCANCGGRIGYFYTKDDAITDWNRRAYE